MIAKKSDDAVSPVIGVMLMVVITVVIAAVITIFATGVVTDTEPAPVATFDIKILTEVTDQSTGPDFQIKHLAGDEIDTKYIEIRTSWTDQNGKYHYSTYSADKFKAEGYPATHGNIKLCKQPMYVESSQGIDTPRFDYGSGGYNYNFGDVVLKPGYKLKTGIEFLGGSPEDYGKTHVGSQFMDIIFNNGKFLIQNPTNMAATVTEKGIMEYLPKGTAVEVTIFHIPSNKPIFSKVVFVE